MSDSKSRRASSFRAAKVILFAAAVAPFAFGCSSSSSSGPSRSGLDESLKLGAATPAQFGQLCDWAANLFGGYGHDIMKQCGDGGGVTETIRAPASHAECVSSPPAPSCTATVAQLEDCENANVSRDPCTETALPPACDAIVACASR